MAIGVVVLRELGAHGRERGFGLPHLDLGVESGGEALRRDAHDIFALRDRGARDLALREEPLQVEIGAGDAGRERTRAACASAAAACACDSAALSAAPFLFQKSNS